MASDPVHSHWTQLSPRGLLALRSVRRALRMLCTGSRAVTSGLMALAIGLAALLGSGTAAVLRACARLATVPLRSLAAHRRRRAERADLTSMADRDMADIGLSRADVSRIIDSVRIERRWP